MQIISRKDARLAGSKRYFTNKPCKYGHTDERRVHDGACCECQRKAYRQYQADNSDKEQLRKRTWMTSWRADMPDSERKEMNAIHYDKYKAGYKARARGRLDACLVATPSWVDTKLLSEFYKACPEGHHVDHIIPLRGVMPDGGRVCGLHVPWNLQYLPAVDNLKKGNRVQRHDLNEVV